MVSDTVCLLCVIVMHIFKCLFKSYIITKVHFKRDEIICGRGLSPQLLGGRWLGEVWRCCKTMLCVTDIHNALSSLKHSNIIKLQYPPLKKTNCTAQNYTITTASIKLFWEQLGHMARNKCLHQANSDAPRNTQWNFLLLQQTDNKNTKDLQGKILSQKQNLKLYLNCSHTIHLRYI